MRFATAVALVTLSLSALAGAAPYDEAADARREVAAALQEAQEAHVPVLVVFGANWCGDCKVLDMAFKQGPTAPLIAKNFRVVKVNVGKFDKNTDLAQSLGVPLKQGIPSVAVLSSQGSVLYVTKAGELADARKMGDTSIYEFFERVVWKTRN
jgi:thioredoxin